MSLQRSLGFGAAVLCLGMTEMAEAAPPALATGGPPAIAVAAIDKSKVVATVSGRNLDATLNVVKDYLPVPFKKEALVSEIFGDFSPLISLSAPADLVVALDTQSGAGDKVSDSGSSPQPPLWAFAVGVRSLDEAQRLFQSRGAITDSKPGWSRLQLTIAGRKLFCLLSAGQPATTGRLSCSKQERDRDAVGPYLARLAPPVENSDLHAELAVNSLFRTYEEPWQRALGMVGLMVPGRLQLGQPTFDRAVTDLTQTLVGQLQGMSRDLQTVAVDLSLAQSGVDLRLGYRMAGQSSWWGQADAEAASRPATGAPAVYWSLPADVTSASFQVSDPKWAKSLVMLLGPLADGFLAHENVPAPDRQAVVDLFTKLIDSTSPGLVTTVVATGKGDQAAPTGAAGDAALLLGGSYYLVSTEGPTAQLSIPWLKALVAAYNRPAIQSYLRAKWKKYELGPLLPSLRLDPLPKSAGAGAIGATFSGTLAFLNRAAANSPPAKPAPVTLHMICVPGSGRLWTAFGTDRPTLLRRLGEQGKLPADKTLAQRPGLESLREAGTAAGGFTSLVSLGSYLDAILAGLSRRSAGKERAQSASLLFNMVPHHGEVPMNYVSRSTVEGSSRKTEILLRVPRMVIEDIAAMTMQLAMEK